MNTNTYKKKSRFKPLYKKLLNLKENIQSRKKILKFKKKKWETFIEQYQKNFKKYNKVKLKDQARYWVTEYASKNASYQKKFKNTLLALKKLNFFYGGSFTKKSLKTHVLKTKNKNSLNPLLFLLKSFESRLDTILYRSKFCISMRQAQQFILHSKILVNNKIIKNKAFKLKPGDLISLNIKNSYLIQKNIAAQNFFTKHYRDLKIYIPKHLSINYSTLQIIFNEIENTYFFLPIPFYLHLERISLDLKYQ